MATLSTKVYLSTEKSADPDTIELTTYFHESLTQDVNHVKMKFASMAQVEDLQFLSRQKLSEQKMRIQDWQNIDKNMNWKIDLDFVKPGLYPQNEAIEVFYSDELLERVGLDHIPLSEDEWRVKNVDGIKKISGCDVSQRMARIVQPINLRSKALEMKLNFILHEDSSLSITTRSKRDNDETTIIKFVKTGTGIDQRLFLYFGILDKLNKEVVYIKRTEIPVLLSDKDAIENNYLDVNCTIHDNGDQFLCVEGNIDNETNYMFKVRYEQVIPYFEEFNVHLSGDKPNVIIKKLQLQVLPRKNLSKVETDSHQKLCCSIF